MSSSSSSSMPSSSPAEGEQTTPKCASCQAPPKGPTKTLPCSHVVCSSCIDSCIKPVTPASSSSIAAQSSPSQEAPTEVPEGPVGEKRLRETQQEVPSEPPSKVQKSGESISEEKEGMSHSCPQCHQPFSTTNLKINEETVPNTASTPVLPPLPPAVAALSPTTVVQPVPAILSKATQIIEANKKPVEVIDLQDDDVEVVSNPVVTARSALVDYLFPASNARSATTVARSNPAVANKTTQIQKKPVKVVNRHDYDDLGDEEEETGYEHYSSKKEYYEKTGRRKPRFVERRGKYGKYLHDTEGGDDYC